MGLPIQSTDTLNFNGLVTGSITGYTIPQGKYVVIYNADDGTLTCSTCSSSQCTVNSTTDLCQEAIYIPCTSSSSCTFDDDMVCFHCLFLFRIDYFKETQIFRR